MKKIEDCGHYWLVIGQKGMRWFEGHALCKCKHCSAWTVVARSEGIGPCQHVLSRALPPVTDKVEWVAQAATCDDCGAIIDGPGPCEWCGESEEED